MPIVDLHAHVTPERYKTGIRDVGSWYGLDATVGELHHGAFAQGLAERLEDMDRFGVEMQLLTPTMGFYQYENDLEVTKKIHRECNDEIYQIISQHPTRFLGMGTVPMQDPASAITEMGRLVGEFGFKGVMINDHVAGTTYDDPQFLPFFQAAEEMGALLFFHQGGPSCVAARIDKYKLPNAVGNLTERALVFATLVFGGVLDKFPGLSLLLAHAGGYAPYSAARMDKVAGALPGDFDGKMNPPFGPNDGFVQKMPPSEYLRRFYYDCCTYDGPVLRFLIDTVGIDRVVFGTDYPAPMFQHDPVEWLRGLSELTATEKEAILIDNSNRLLGI
ncbi:MAG: amidohydrolase family protein [Acidimicrobiia bacterium]|nr:amidohydrolase family protein [Acidimicrobiia bacterium]